jgi:hypothetical protein
MDLPHFLFAFLLVLGIYFIFLFCFCLVGLEFELRTWSLQTKQVLYHLRHTFSQLFSNYFWRSGLANYFPRLASNCNPPNLRFPSGYRYRDAPQAPIWWYWSFELRA